MYELKGMNAMRTKRNLLVMAAVLVFSVAVWGVVAAQDATEEPTAEPSTTEVAPEPASERPFLGVLLEEGDNGVSIAEVNEGSAAADADLQVGDVITAVNGSEVTTVKDVADAIGALAVGDEVSLDITRDGEAMTVTATLGATTELPGGQGPRGDREGREGRMLGLEYNEEDQSWTITRLSEDSPLYAAGLRENDVITGVDGNTHDLRGLADYLSTLEDDATVSLNVERDGEAQDIQIGVSDLKGLFIPGIGFDFGRGGNLPEGFMDMMPMFQGMYGNGRLGLSFETIDEQVAADNSLTVTDGALVQSVEEGSAAAEAGVQVGDVITAVNGEAVDAEHTLRDRMIAYEAGDTVTLTVLRDSESMDLQATLTEPEMGDFRGMFEDMIPFEAPAVEVTPQANA
jgi:S1-C subfamily serine protease